MSDQDKRSHLRYRDPEGGALRLLVRDGDSESTLRALMVNESYAGLACVYVGSALAVGRELLWQETELVRTSCTVVCCEPLYTDVYLLALQIRG
jgi:hypothetical protein